jgi:hypothetical protein
MLHAIQIGTTKWSLIFSKNVTASRIEAGWLGKFM